MHNLDILPFPIGTTWSQNGSPASTDGRELEGRVFEVEDLNWGATGPKTARAYDANGGNGRTKLVKIVRNAAGVTLVAGMLVTYKVSAQGRQVDGMCCTTAQEVAGAVDEFLPYAVPTNDLFYITISGNAGVMCGMDGASANALSTASTTQLILVALTAVTSQATTAGRMTTQDLTGATALLGAQIQNRIGIALSARTTNQTNTLALCYLYNNRKW